MPSLSYAESEMKGHPEAAARCFHEQQDVFAHRVQTKRRASRRSSESRVVSQTGVSDRAWEPTTGTRNELTVEMIGLPIRDGTAVASTLRGPGKQPVGIIGGRALEPTGRCSDTKAQRDSLYSPGEREIGKRMPSRANSHGSLPTGSRTHVGGQYPIRGRRAQGNHGRSGRFRVRMLSDSRLLLAEDACKRGLALVQAR